MNIRRIIAREGLIIILIGLILGFSFSFLRQNIPAAFPKYRLEFNDGRVYIIDIHPDYYYAPDAQRAMREFFEPGSRILEKRRNEFIKQADIRSPLKEARLIRTWQLYLSRLLFKFLSINLLLATGIIYLFLTIPRFIFWAIKMFKPVKGQSPG